ncbi:MAG: type IV pilin-like G/H family protein [Coleofasciculus sp. G3-WIS-01]|uniref:protein kinase domain-containing protein n=1 Tax=Coleofasciculus sp. G3-WIS-01 TaxID=3069528 RepID=UPI0032FFDBDE
MVWATGDALYNGKYILERQLGQGRLGITYLVKDRDNCRWVIKTLNDALLNSLTPQEQNRLETKFCQEAVKLNGCNHPHIVKVRELFKDGKRWCIVMDYVDGMSLAYRAQKMLPEAEALNYIQQIGEALIEVHRDGLIHRDVKPGNIIRHVRDGKAEAVLIDFGIAKELMMNREQQKYFLENGKYSKSKHELSLLINNTKQYIYSSHISTIKQPESLLNKSIGKLGFALGISNSNTKTDIQGVFNYGISRNNKLKSYVGAVVVRELSKIDEPITLSILCESKSLDTPPPEPIYKNGKLACSSGTQEVSP